MLLADWSALAKRRGKELGVTPSQHRGSKTPIAFYPDTPFALRRRLKPLGGRTVFSAH